MAQNSFIPRSDDKRISWIVNFAQKLPNYKDKYNIPDQQVSDVQSGSVFANTWYAYAQAVKKHTDKVLAYNTEQMNGTAGATASEIPTQPLLPALAAPPPGIFARAIAIAKSIKTQSGYTDADGRDMGLVGTESSMDVHAMKPAIKLRLISGGRPEVVWKKQGMDGVEIYKDSGDGNFTMLAYDSYPNYTDMTALPAAGQSAIWKYKCIYKYKDEHAGQWSDVVSITVSGN